LSALSTCDALGYSGFFSFYGTLGILGSIWYTLNIPETKGKTLEEITAMFKSKYDKEDADATAATSSSSPSSLKGGGMGGRQEGAYVGVYSSNENPIHSPLAS
jgi:hypothetical protein